MAIEPASEAYRETSGPKRLWCCTTCLNAHGETARGDGRRTCSIFQSIVDVRCSLSHQASLPRGNNRLRQAQRLTCWSQKYPVRRPGLHVGLTALEPSSGRGRDDRFQIICGCPSKRPLFLESASSSNDHSSRMYKCFYLKACRALAISTHLFPKYVVDWETKIVQSAHTTHSGGMTVRACVRGCHVRCGKLSMTSCTASWLTVD